MRLEEDTAGREERGESGGQVVGLAPRHQEDREGEDEHPAEHAKVATLAGEEEEQTQAPHRQGERVHVEHVARDEEPPRYLGEHPLPRIL